jgi:hypothetical protein
MSDAPGSIHLKHPDRGRAAPSSQLLLERLQLVSQRKTAAMDPALRGCETDPERVRDLLVGEAGEIAQDHRLPLLEGKLHERGDDPSVEVVSFGGTLRKGVHRNFGGALRLERVEVRGRVLLAPSSRQRRVDTDPIEPGEEGGVAAVAVEIPPGLDEGVLDGFLDVPRVVEDPQQHDPDAMLVASHDLRERLEISLLRQPHELGIGLLARRHPEIVRS